MTSDPEPHLVILGADGFIGSAVVRRALAAGAQVTALCIADPWRLAAAPVEPVVVGDRWASPGFGKEILLHLRGATALVVLAYRPPTASDDAARAEHEAAVNTSGARVAAHVAARSGARVVFASTGDVYGRWHAEPVDETTSPHPETPYALAKLEAEAAVREAAPDTTSLRIATVFGPGETGHRAIPRFLTAMLAGRPITIHGDGSDVRDYVHVDDVAGAVLRAAVVLSVPPVVNVGSGVGRSTREIAAAVSEALFVTPTIVHEQNARPLSRLVLDVTLARRALGFEPRHDLANAVRAEADWLRAHLAARAGRGAT